MSIQQALLMVSASSGGWTTTANLTTTGDEGGWNGYTLRQIMPASAFAAGSRVRFRLHSSATGGSSCNIGAVYFGPQAASGDPYDFDTTPSQLLFSGVGNVALGTNQQIITDELVVPVSASVHVLAVYFNAAAGVRFAGSVSGWDYYYKLANDASTVNATGYTAGTANRSMLVTGVEVFQP